MLAFQEIRLEVDIENVAAQTLDGVDEGQDLHALALFYVETRVHANEVTELYAQIIVGDLERSLTLSEKLAGFKERDEVQLGSQGSRCGCF
jgi:hypothetical protein